MKTTQQNIISIIRSDSFKKQVEAALPKHIAVDRVIRIILTELRRMPKLLECNNASIMGAIMQASQLGLEIGSNLGYAYLVPYKNECQLIIGYKGLMALARRSGDLISISAREVCENDDFTLVYGINEELRHVPLMGERGKIIGFYAIAHLKSGGCQFDYMTVDEIESIKNTSKTSNSYNSPWKSFYTEMSKKTAIRRLCKYLSLSPELTTAVSIDEMADAGVQNISYVDIDDNDSTNSSIYDTNKINIFELDEDSAE